MKPDDLSVITPTGEQASTPSAARPGWPLVADSLVVIGISIVFLSLSIRMLTDRDGSSVLLGLSMILLSTTVGLLQHAACFRQSAGAARVLAWLHCVGLYGFLILGVVLSPLAIGASWRAVFPVFFFLLAMLAGWNVLCLSRRSRQLAAGALSEPEDLFREKRPFQLSIAELLGAMTVVALVAGLATWMIRSGL